MRKLVSLLGVLAVLSIAATAAMAGPIPGAPVAGSVVACGAPPATSCVGESDFGPNPGGPAVGGPRPNVDWMVLDLGTGPGGAPNAVHRAAFDVLVHNPFYIPAGGMGPAPAFGDTLYAYLYVGENTTTFTMASLAVQFDTSEGGIIAAGALVTGPLLPAPLTPFSPLPGQTPIGLAGTMNLGAAPPPVGPIDDFDLDSTYHPGHNAALFPFLAPSHLGFPDPIPADLPGEEEGPPDAPFPFPCVVAPGDVSCFSIAAGDGIFTAVNPDSVTYSFLGGKPPLHESATLYILSTQAPIYGSGGMLDGSEWGTNFPGGEPIPVPASIPEPSTFLLIGLGLGCLVANVARRKYRA